MYDPDIIPKDGKHNRACLYCGLVKSLSAFIADGCENCESFLNMKNDEERARSCTSANHQGTLFIMDPTDSFIARYHSMKKSVPGQYAMSVCGTLPAEIVEELQDANIRYEPHARDIANA
uniref:Transcription elongation factor SPT4 n=1 Tax=Rhabditophanes sp. KR3021 TaxID=114890 RepID=A0AC35U0J8_9BILA